MRRKSNIVNSEIQGVILAAGLSSRAGVYKLSLEINKRTIIESCIEGMYDVCSKIIVVGGYNFEIITEILSGYPKVKLVYNPNYEDGMFSSVKIGIEYVNGSRFFLIPGDYPLVRKETYIRMLAAEGDIVIPMYEGRRGHPILIKSYLKEDILTNACYTNLRDFINLHDYLGIDVEDAEILEDVDTMEDYANILRRMSIHS